MHPAGTAARWSGVAGGYRPHQTRYSRLESELKIVPMPSVSVILSTYNSPVWLEKVIWGYMQQTFRDFEIVIADDGSTDDTRLLIRAISEHSGVLIMHVWQ